MFTINIYVRFALIALGLVGGIALSATQGFWYGIIFILAAIVLLVGYFLLGTMNSAAQLMQFGDLEGAAKRLDLTIKPDWLYQPVRGSFYLIKATMKLQAKQPDEAEPLLVKSLQIGLPSDNETAMVNMQLASIAAQKSQWVKAEQYVKVAKTYKITEPELKSQLDQFSKGLAQRGQQSTMMMRHGMAGGRQGGSKRRTPRAR